MTKGSITCSQKKCPTSKIQETTTQKIDIFVVCRYNGQIYKFGQTFIAIDKCNQCRCKTKGSIECTKKICPATKIQETTPEPLKPTPEPLKPTPEPLKPTPEPLKPTPEPLKPHSNTVSCTYEGYIYTLHATFLARDGCNQCSCMYSSKVLCTKKSCSIYTGLTGESSHLSETGQNAKCVYHGKIYKITEIFIAIDQCNSCECIFPGRVICTHSTCDETTGENGESSQPSQENKYPIMNLDMQCFYHGKIYKITQTFVSFDHCNSCECIFPGRVICGQKSCQQAIVHKTLQNPPPKVTVLCEYNGITYNAGVSFISADACNKCSCSYMGKISCMKSVCPTTKVFTERKETLHIKLNPDPATKAYTCLYNGFFFEIGEVFNSIDGCDTCECKRTKEVICNKTPKCLPVIKSPPADEVVCIFEGISYNIGAVFLAKDGCNSCKCTTEIRIMCTESICISKIVDTAPTTISLPIVTSVVYCKHDGAFYRFGRIFHAGDGCNLCGCSLLGKVICTRKLCSGIHKPTLPPFPLKTEMFLNMCFYKGRLYNLGSTYTSEDGCSRCVCKDKREMDCKRDACNHSKKSKASSIPIMCKSENACYSVDSTFITSDGCNLCRCQKSGKSRCSKICGSKKKSSGTARKRNLVKCVYESKIYYAGARFLTKSGCKTCFCLNSGSLYCTSGNCKEKSKKKLGCSGTTKITASWYALEDHIREEENSNQNED